MIAIDICRKKRSGYIGLRENIHLLFIFSVFYYYYHIVINNILYPILALLSLPKLILY